MESIEIAPRELAFKYIALATAEGTSKLSGDYKKGNMLAKKLYKIFLILQSNPTVATQVLGIVLKSDSLRARSLGAVDALRLNVLVNDAVSVLEEASKSSDIFGFGSEMALKIWRGEVSGRML